MPADANAQQIEKGKPSPRVYDKERRLQLAEMEEALPDGSFPIVDVLDLRAAIVAIDEGRAKDIEVARAHVLKRAQELKASDELPEEWSELNPVADTSDTAGGAPQPAPQQQAPQQPAGKSALSEAFEDFQTKSWEATPRFAPVIEEKADVDVVNQEALTSLTRGRGPRRGNLEDLLKYWRPIMKKPGGFRRCLVILADHPELYPLERICAWLHHETTGKWPNEGNKKRIKKGSSRKRSGKVIKKAGRVAKRSISKKEFEDFIEIKKVGAFGAHSRGGQALEAAGSSLLPGNLSMIRSPGRSSIFRALTPGGRGGGGGGFRARLGQVLTADGPGGARNKYRCPPGFQQGGTFTDPEFSTCGSQILALPDTGPGSLSPEANEQIHSLINKSNLVQTIGQLSKNRNAEQIIYASQISPKPKKVSSNREVGVGLVLGRLNAGDDFGDRVVRSDGVVLKPVVDRRSLASLDEFDDMADGSYITSYKGGALGLEEAAIFSTGLRDAYVYVPGTGNAVKISREGGELSREDIAGLRPGLASGQASSQDKIDNPAAAIVAWQQNSDNRFSIEIGEIVENRFVPEPQVQNEMVVVHKDGKTMTVPRWTFEMFLKPEGYHLKEGAQPEERGDGSLSVKQVHAGSPEGEPSEFRRVQRPSKISGGFKRGPLRNQTVGSKEAAEKIAATLGCSGAHQVGENEWMPCESKTDLQRLIKMGNPSFRMWKMSQKMLTSASTDSLGDHEYTTQHAATIMAHKMGCVGSHVKRSGVWSPCQNPEVLSKVATDIQGNDKNPGSRKLTPGRVRNYGDGHNMIFVKKPQDWYYNMKEEASR